MTVGVYHLPEKSGWADRAFCVTNRMEWILPFTPVIYPMPFQSHFVETKLKKTGKCDRRARISLHFLSAED